MRKHVIPTLSIVLGLYFIGIAVMGFIGAAPMVNTFDAIGIGQWFRYVTACCQLLGGILLLRPRTRPFGAVLVCCVLIGAVITRILFMKVTPLPAIILLAVAGAILLHTAMAKRRKA